MEEMKKCAICGITAESKIITTVHGTLMCSKHKAQFYRHGQITDRTSRTTQDKNEIIMHEDYAELIVYKDNNTKKNSVIIDKDDTARISQYKWRIEYRKNNKSGYIVAGARKNRIYLHRLIMNYAGSLQVDHINRNTFDNRKINLRIVSQITNNHNKALSCCIDKQPCGKYRVQIVRFKRRFLFGLFETFEEAVAVRDEFIDFIEKNRAIMVENYYKEIDHKKCLATFVSNNKIVHSKMFKTVVDTIENRPDLQSLLHINDKTA